MDQIVINPSPKARFMQNANGVKAHRAMAQSDAFESAVQTTLLEYQGILANDKNAVGNGSVAAANFYKQQGALEFANLLKTLAESPKQFAPTVDRDNLKHS